MGKLSTHLSIIWYIIRKDLGVIIRDKLWVYLSVAFLVIYIALYWLLPSTVDETLAIGIHQKDLDKVIELYLGEEEGLEVIEFDSSKQLKAAIEGKLETEKKITLGIDFPDDFLAKITSGEKSAVQVYVDASVPEEIRNAISGFVREIAYGIYSATLGVTDPDEALPVKFPEEERIILGEDRAGNQVPFREKFKPLLAFFVLMIESMALASLIATEVQRKTVTAILITPATTGDVLIAKTLFGTFITFSQVAILLLAINAFGTNALLLLVILVLGAIMMTGVGLISGAGGKDFINTLFLSFVFIIPLMIPAFAVLFPGTASAWVRILPTYGLAQALIRSTTYAEGWIELLPYIAMLAAWNTVIFGAGLFTLKRRVESL